ncbi:DNA mismatch repair endonuclease MutL [Vibrio palustris]|uniref:DNA mismatch repair protein MutL n=1 Tax=Vibrio palustris TaxID=1918946 RepID=A0A1R4B8E6_9VIBR|nr:DNA mismatch repair endonuclease MutL [Vibrio palustris]SJL85192.1 DNA mismatch repair protein MutL [Vibrio palustris]
MAIQILPARLANQIAAGEVVERPASVVKELVENSLDSGATRIDIDIDKGGAKLIRIRDNGVGIPKDELALALSRHATSKIHNLDDLEAIMSLGFRGEALASISSVARLTMTSRPATQEEAWSAHSEGREMAVKTQPAAHPVGTTVEVLDLFFNTPARRKFLRTEKTEFTHIDELIKRVALSRFDVTFNLRHNGKMIRQYRAAKSPAQEEKRLAAVCGNSFVRNMLHVTLDHQGMKLSGWVSTPEGARQQNELQYCYVNGRMMKDKLINHAIRQSYETSLRPDQYATYVLFIEVDPHQVDVNVHPAKHEVRFQQARLVHDFIYQALSSALAQGDYVDEPAYNQAAFSHDTQSPAQAHDDSQSHTPLSPVSEQVWQAAEQVPAYPGQKDYRDSSREQQQGHVAEPNSSQSWSSVSRDEQPRTTRTGGPTSAPRRAQEEGPSLEEVQVYQHLLETPLASSLPEYEDVAMTSANTVAQTEAVTQLGKALDVINGEYLLMTSSHGCVLVSLARAQWLRVRGQLKVSDTALKSQPLLVPFSIKSTPSEHASLERYKHDFLMLGIDLQPKSKQAITVMGVPQPLRQQNLQQLMQDLLSYASSTLDQHDVTLTHEHFAYWLSDQVVTSKTKYTLSEGIQLISELELLWEGQLPLTDRQFVQKVDFSATIAALNS